MIGLNSYIKPRITNQIFFRKYGSISNNLTYSLFYNNVGGTIVPLKLAIYNDYTNFPAPRTGLGNTQTFFDYLQTPFTYFNTFPQHSGPYTYPDAVNIPIANVPANNSPQYVETFSYTHNSNLTRSYMMSIDISSSGLGSTSGLLTFYIYINGAEQTRLSQYSISANYGGKGGSVNTIVTLNPSDIIEIRYTQTNSTGSSEGIRNMSITMYELKN